MVEWQATQRNKRLQVPASAAMRSLRQTCVVSDDILWQSQTVARRALLVPACPCGVTFTIESAMMSQP